MQTGSLHTHMPLMIYCLIVIASHNPVNNKTNTLDLESAITGTPPVKSTHISFIMCEGFHRQATLNATPSELDG